MPGPTISWKTLDAGAWRSEIVERGRYQLASPSTVTGNPSLAMQAGQSCTVRVYIGDTLYPDASLTVSGTTPVAILNAIGQPLTGQEKFDLVIEVAMPYGGNLTTTDEPNGSPSAPFASTADLYAWAALNLSTLYAGRSTAWVGAIEYRFVGPGADVWGAVLRGDGNPVWTGFGDSLAATTWAFPSTAILMAGNQLVGQSNYAEGINSFGYSGKRSDEIIQYIPAVIASGAKTVIVIVGANDRLQNVAVATFYANLRAIYAGLIAGGVRVFGSYLAPEDTKPLLTYPYNCAVRKAASEFGVNVLSPFDAVTNPADAKWVSGKSSDGTHPNALASGDCGAVAAGQISTGVYPRLYATSNIGGLVANACFTEDSNSDGTPDNWLKQTTGNMVPTVSLVASDVGKAARITFSAASGAVGDGAILKTQTPFAVVPGNKLYVTGVCKVNSISGASAVMGVTFLNAAYGYITERFMLPGNRLVGKKLFASAEITTPANAAFAIVVIRASALSFPCSGEVDFERIQAIDLTAIGLG